MKAPIGLALIFLGITVGYLVLAGKLPNPNVTQSNPSGNPAIPPGQSTQASGSNPTGVGSGPLPASQVKYV